ncbi:uncharacterized protein DUF3105 [Kineococcus xinjiangensis]|uniref:Uncharacterized protein DUF3105 n=1 Tax=Kineococcus xinjiangensis TaxID=512762 RepID=A0A2S6IXF1_9ACTN|nr:DUF3105 domain-containing protein [Kineococcus xinjiangensis]PPK98821.1 uncharacterized protein DUF3105 [Kineococcus xinjiangensis]
MAGTTDGPEQAAHRDSEAARVLRAERVAKMQREQRGKERRSRLLVVGGIAVAAVAVIAIVAGVIASHRPPSLDAVKTFTYEAGAHTEEDVAYTENPPAGGEHDFVWQNCGIYDEPVRDENAVHSMEHGAVWITYRPDLAEQQVSELKTLVANQQYVLLAPREDLPAPVVATAWNNQLELEGASDKRLDEFLKKFQQGPQTPEPGAPCTGGTGTPTS